MNKESYEVSFTSRELSVIQELKCEFQLDDVVVIFGPQTELGTTLHAKVPLSDIKNDAVEEFTSNFCVNCQKLLAESTLLIPITTEKDW